MDIVADTYQKLSDLLAVRDEKGAHRLLVERFKSLPEDLQGKILVAYLTDAVNKKAEQEKILQKTQEEALSAAKALIVLKESLEKDGGKSA